MTDITERTEALLTAMGWTRRLNGMWAVDVPKWERDTVTASRPSLDWCFRHAIPWATARGWAVMVDRELDDWLSDEMQEEAHVDVRTPMTYSQSLRWKPGEPDRTAEAIVTALYDALMGERDG